MSTFDDVLDVVYELSDREIYNDIRSQIGITESSTETIVDADPTYEWRYYTANSGLPASWRTNVKKFTAAYNAITWKIDSHSAMYQDTDGSWKPYYDYSVWIESSDSSHCEVHYKNTGSSYASLHYVLKYKYMASEGFSHEDTTTTYSTLTVRATDEDSISKYGRRVMNLLWPEGQTEVDMQSLVEWYLAKYKEPVATVRLTVVGGDDTKKAAILDSDYSDRDTVTLTALSLDTNFFIDRVDIRDDLKGMPIAHLELVEVRPEEALGLFTLDTSELDGPDILG